VGALAADPGQLAAVEHGLAELDEGVGAALGGGAGIVGSGRAGDGVESGAEGGAALGVESAVEVEDTIEGLAQVEVAALVLVAVVGESAVGVDTVAEVAGEAAEVLGVEVGGGLEQVGLGAAGGLQADLLGGAGDDGGVVAVDLALGEGLLGGWQLWELASQADLLGGGAWGEAAGGAEEGGGVGEVEGGEGAGAVEGGDRAVELGFQGVAEAAEVDQALGQGEAGEAVEVVGAERGDGVGEEGEGR
jgi:hypothetical protein